MDADRRELHRLVDALPEDQVALMLADLRSRLRLEVAGRSWPPAFFGMGDDKDGRTDLSERVDEVLADGFGAPADERSRDECRRDRESCLSSAPRAPSRGPETVQNP